MRDILYCMMSFIWKKIRGILGYAPRHQTLQGPEPTIASWTIPDGPERSSTMGLFYVTMLDNFDLTVSFNSTSCHCFSPKTVCTVSASLKNRTCLPSRRERLMLIDSHWYDDSVITCHPFTQNVSDWSGTALHGQKKTWMNNWTILPLFTLDIITALLDEGMCECLELLWLAIE